MVIKRACNNYFKVIIASRRAKQIQKGAQPLVHLPGLKATRIALEEIELGLIHYEFPPDQIQEETIMEEYIIAE